MIFLPLEGLVFERMFQVASTTLSQGVRLGDLRRSRYIGLPKTRLLHLLIAAALNVVRIVAWLAETPLARTRTPPFVALGKAVACY